MVIPDCRIFLLFTALITICSLGVINLPTALNFMCHDGRRESEIVLEKRKKLLIIVCLLTNVDFYLGMLKLVPLAVNRILLKVKLI